LVVFVALWLRFSQLAIPDNEAPCSALSQDGLKKGNSEPPFSWSRMARCNKDIVKNKSWRASQPSEWVNRCNVGHT
jgi:hypothetical protein